MRLELVKKYLKFFVVLVLGVLCANTSTAQLLDNTTVCGGSVYRIQDPAVLGFPPGLSSDNIGTWSSDPADLTFEPPTVFQTLVTGFAPNTLYKLYWRSSKNGKLYQFNIQTRNVTAKTGTIEVENPAGVWTTGDVVFCAGGANPSQNFRIPGADLVSYAFWRTADATGLDNNWQASSALNSGTLSGAGYNSLDMIWGITVDDQGCKSYTNNQIRLAPVTSTVVRVVGGESTCGNVVPVGLDLEVLPFSSGGALNYQWYKNNIAIPGETSSIYSVVDFGSYHVEVAGCAVPFVTNSVDVTSDVVPAVSLSGDNICKVGDNTILTSSFASAPVNPVTYEWYYGGSEDVSLLTGSTATVTLAGDYQVLARSMGNAACYSISDPFSVNVNDIQTVFSKVNNAVPFCSTDGDPLRTPVYSLNVTGGTGPYDVVVSDGASNYTYQVADGVTTDFSPSAAIASTTSYNVVSVTDAAGCVIAPATLASLVFNVNQQPLGFNVLGGTACSSGALTIGLDGTENGVVYELLLNGNPLMPASMLVGTGTVISNMWQVTDVGNYTVRAQRGNCLPVVMMTGSATMAAIPADQAMVPASACLSGNVQLTATENNVSYRLYLNNVYTGTTILGDGTPQTFNGLTGSGAYTIEAVNASCSRFLTGSFSLINPTDYSLSAVGGKNYYCAGTTSDVDLESSGSQLNYGYQLYNITTGAFWDAKKNGTGLALTWDNVPAGKYKMVVTTPDGCSKDMGDVTVVEQPLPTAALQSDNFERCLDTPQPGGYNLTVTLTGVAPFSYNIQDNFGQDNLTTTGNSTEFNNYNPNVTTSYTITTVADKYCSNTGIGLATISVHEINAAITGPDEVCAGGAITLNALPASVADYDYDWGTATTPSITETQNANETYTVKVTSKSNGCFETASKTVTVNPLPVVNFTGLESAYCINDATVTLTPSAPGTGQFYMKVGAGAYGPIATHTFEPSIIGSAGSDVTASFYYRYTDAKTCSNNTPEQTTTIKPLSALSISGLYPTYCKNSSVVTLIGNPGGGTFTVLGAGLDYTAVANSGAITFDPSKSAAGNFTFTYTYNNGACEQTVTGATIISDSFTGVLSMTGLTDYCPSNNTDFPISGLLNGAAITAGTGVFSGPGIKQDVAGITAGTATFNPFDAQPGIHTITFTYNDPVGCVGVETFDVKVGEVLKISGLAPRYCEGDPAITVTGTPSQSSVTGNDGRFEITSPSGVVSYDNQSTVVLNPSTLAGIKEGEYTITYLLDDAAVAGCDLSVSQKVKIFKKPDPAFEVLKDNYCYNEASVLLIQKNPKADDQISFSGPGITLNYFDPKIAGVGPTTVVAGVTNSVTGCKATSSKTTNVVAAPAIALLLNDTYCETDAPFTFTTSNGSEDGTFTFTGYSSINGKTCVAQANSTDHFATFDPSVGEGEYDITCVFVPDPVTGTGCGQTITKTVTIYRNDPVDFWGLNSTYCRGDGVVTLGGSFGSATFAINSVGNVGLTNHAGGTASFDPSALPVGNYIVTYSYVNGSGCTASVSKNVEIKEVPTVYAVTGGGKYCTGGAGTTIKLSDSEDGVVYELLLNGASLSTPVTQTGPVGGGEISFANVTQDGYYTIKATNANGCWSLMQNKVFVTETELSVTASWKNVKCNGGNTGEGNVSIDSGTGTAPYSYNWQNAASLTVATVAKAENLLAGNYTVTVTDSVGCTDSWTVAIGEPSAIVVSLTSTDATCNCSLAPVVCDGSAELTVSGGTGSYDIKWSDWQPVVLGSGTSLSGLGTGSYTVMVKDDNQCTENRSFTIGVKAPIVVTEVVADHKNVTCYGAANGKITLVATVGGIDVTALCEFSFDETNWFTATQIAALALDAGSYNAWARYTGNNGCHFKIASPIAITQPSAALTLTEVVASRKNTTCSTLDDGRLEVKASGGSGIYEYSKDATIWQVLPSFTGLASGTYYIWVRDNNGCEYKSLPPIEIEKPLVIDFSTSLKNLTCNGSNDGSITITASGGNAASIWGYSLDNLNWQSSSVFNGEGAGTYTVYLRDEQSSNCTVSKANIALTEPVAIGATLDAASLMDVKCHGGSTGSFAVEAIPVGAALTYSLTGAAVRPGQAMPTFSGLAAGTYFVSVEQGSCIANNVLQVDVTEPLQDLSISNVTVTDVTCSGNSNLGNIADGSVTVTVAGGTAPYTLQWYNSVTSSPIGIGNGGNTLSISNMPAGKYYLKVNDGGNCTFTSPEYTINQPTDWNVLQTTANLTAVGANDGSINITNISGGSSPYGISWADGAAFDGQLLRNGLAKGVYAYTLKDSKGCEYGQDAEIFDNHALSFTTKAANVKCFGANTGSIDVLIANGVAPYLVEWSGTDYLGAAVSGSAPVAANGIFVISSLKAGTNYKVKVTDSNVPVGQLDQSVAIVQPTSALSVAVSQTDVTCNGESDGTILVVPSGGTPFPLGEYDIFLNPGSGVTDIAHTFVGLDVDVYEVTVRDSYGCEFKNDYPIVQPNALVVTVIPTLVSCSGGSDGKLEAQVSGRAPGYGFQYDWEMYDGSAWVNYPADDGLPIQNNVPSGIYRVAVKCLNDGCEVVSAPVDITQSSALASLKVTPTHISTCFGDNTGAVQVDVTGGLAPYTLDYSGPMAGTISGNGPLTVNNLIAGTYSLTLKDVRQCVLTFSVDIDQPTAMAVTNLASLIACETPKSGTISFDLSGGAVIGGVQKYNVILQGPEGRAINTVVNAGDTYNAAFIDLPEGIYKLTVKDLNSSDAEKCKYEETITLSNIHILGNATDATCKGINSGAISNVSIQGTSSNYTWSWSTVDGTGLNSSSLSQTGLSAGTYVLEVVDADRAGCVVSRSFVVGNAHTLVINDTKNDLSCFGDATGSVTVESVSGATGNLSYFWDGNTAVGQSSQLLGLDVGAVQLEVRDGLGCSVSKSYQINQPAEITFNLTSNLVASNPYNRTITLSDLAGGTGSLSEFTYTWHGPGIAGSSANTLVGTDNAAPVNPLLSDLTVGGTYFVSVSDKNGTSCSATRSITIPGDIKLSPTVTHLNCNGNNTGSILCEVTNGSGNYTYVWAKPGDAAFVDPGVNNLSGLSAGTYQVEVTDVVQSYSKKLDIVVTQPDPISITGSIGQVSCASEDDGNISLVVSGGGGTYQYNWNTADGSGLSPFNQNQTGLTAGIYTVVVGDGTCSETASFAVTEPQPITFDFVQKNRTCAGIADLEVTNVNGGSGVYNYHWIGPDIVAAHQGQTQLPALNAGTYVVTVSDKLKSGCNSPAKTQIIDGALSVKYVATPLTCSSVPDGAIDVTVTGGVAPLSYSWSDGSLPKVGDQAGLPAGTYSLTVTDASACSLTVNDIVVESKPKLTILGVTTPENCYNAKNGTITISAVTGGSGNYSYSWTGAGANPVATVSQVGLGKGFYTVTVTDNVSGCQESRQFEVGGPISPLTLALVNATSIDCKGEREGAITVAASGGTPGYTYMWSGPATFVAGAVQSDLRAGTYSVFVLDNNGCQSTPLVVDVNEPADSLKLQVLGVTHVLSNGDATGAIDVAVMGGTLPYSLTWSGTDYEGNTVIIAPGTYNATNLKAGVYEVTVVDGKGCSTIIDNISVRQPGGLFTLSVDVVDVKPCGGDDSGVIRVLLTGGDLPFAIRLYDGANNLISTKNLDSYSFGGLSAGTYRLEAEDANLIIRSQDNIVVSEPALLQLNTSVSQHVVCHGDASGIIDVSVAGGVVNSGLYKVIVSGQNYYDLREDIAAGSTYSYTNLLAGEYSIRLIDDGNGDGLFSLNADCWIEKKVTIAQPEALVTLSGTQSVCKGNTANLVLVTSNWAGISTNPLTVTLSNGSVVTVNESPEYFSFVPTQSEVISIADVSVGSCKKGTGAGSAVVSVNEKPSAKIFGNATVCSGETTPVSFYLSGIAPWTVVYENGVSVVTKTNISASPYVVNVTPTSTNTYALLSVTDANCSQVYDATLPDNIVTVTVNDLPSVSMSGNATICSGKSTNLVFTFVSGASPWDVTIKVNGVEQTLTNILGPTFSYSVKPTVTTEYELVSVKDVNGCVQPASGKVTVSVLPLPQNTGNITGPSFVCQGQTNVQYTISPVQDATGYVWTLPSSGYTQIAGGDTSITVNIADDALDGTISVYAVNGCGNSPLAANVLVSVNRLPLKPGVISSSLGNKICQGTKGLVLSIDPVNDAEKYEWTLPSGFNIVSGQGSTRLLVDLDPLQSNISGPVSVKAINNCGSGVVSDPYDITINPLPGVFAGNDQGVCGATATLGATDPGSNHSGSWKLVTGAANISAAGTFNSGLTNLAQGPNVFEWTVTNTVTQCVNSDRVTVTNHYTPVVAWAAKPTTCDGTVTVTGTQAPNADYSGLWSFVVGTGSIDNANAYSTKISNLKPGTSKLRWTLVHKNGCADSYADVEIVNDTPADAIILNKTSVKNRCDDFVSLSAVVPSAGSTGSWSLLKGSGVFDNDQSAGVVVSGLSQGDNEFQWTVVKGGCSKTDVVTVRNNQLTVSAGADKEICDDFVANLQGSKIPLGVSTAYWSIVPGKGSALFVNAALNDTRVNQLGPDENHLVWQLTQNGCVSSDTVIITNNKPTVSVVGLPLDICGNAAQLSANTPINGSQGYWTVTSGFGRLADAKDPNTQVTDLAEGTNKFRWNIVKNGCFASVSEMVVDNNRVKVNAGKDFAVCESNAALNADVPAKGVGEWSVVSGMGGGTFYNPVTGLRDEKVPNPNVAGLQKGINGFVFTVNYNSCASSDTIYVTNNITSEVSAGPDEGINGSVWNLQGSTLATGEKGTWSIVSGSGNIADVHDGRTAVSGLQQGPNIFRWTVDNQGCVNSDEVTITNGEITAANAGLDQYVCSDQVTLQANSPGVGFGEWSIVYGAGRFESNSNNKTLVTGLAQGENIFRWTLRYGDSYSSDVVSIFNISPTTANAGIDKIICDDTYVLEGNDPSGRGNVTWTLISGGGTLSNASLFNSGITGLAKGVNLLKYEIKYVYNNRACTSVDSVRINNITPTQSFAGPDQAVCADSVLLSYNNPTYGKGEWLVHQGYAEIRDGWATKLAQGANKLVWKISSTAGCYSADTVVLVNNTPSIAYAGQDQPICTNFAQLTANEPEHGTGHWELLTGAGTITDNANANTMVNGLSLGGNRFRWVVDNNGCESSDDVEVTNNAITAFAGFAQANCADTAMLSANSPYPGVGTWGIAMGTGSGNALFDNLESPSTLVRGLDRGENLLTWTINYKGCKSVSEVLITNNNPSVANAGPDQPLCVDFAMLSANIPVVGQGSWSIRNGGGQFEDLQKPNSKVDGLSFGSNIFRWTIQNKNCTSFDDVVVANHTVAAIVGDDQEICSSSTTLDGNNASPGVGSWSVVGGTSQAVFADKSSSNTTVNNLGRGMNTLRWTIINQGCQTSADVVIVNNSPSKAYAGNMKELCAGSIVLDASPVAMGQGTWEVLTGSATMANVNDPKTAVTGLSKGDNVFRWRVRQGVCFDDDEVLIVNNEPSLPYAGTDDVVCTPTFQLKATNPEFGSGIWSIIKGSGQIENPQLPSSVISSLGYGENTFRWTVSKGQCSLYDDVTLLSNAPTTANAGPDIQDCKNYSILDGNVPSVGSGTWSLVSGKGTFVDGNNGKTRIENLGFGENVLQWTIKNGSCFSTDLVTVFNKIPDQSFAGSDSETCDDYMVLNGNNPLTGKGKWSVLSGTGTFVDDSRYDTKVTDLGFGENRFVWTIAYGECVTQDNVLVNSYKTNPVAGDDAVVYEPDYKMMAVNPGAVTASWSLLGGSGTFADASYFGTTVAGLREGVNTFRWTTESHGCIAFDDVTITFKAMPDAGFATDVSEGCYPLTVKFSNLSVNGSACTWDFGDGTTSSLRNPSHVYEISGSYHATLTISGPDGKNAVFGKTITVYEHPKADFSVAPSSVYLPNQQLRCYNQSVGARNSWWDFGDGGTSRDVNPLYQYNQVGTYSITLTVDNQFGCRDSLLVANAVEVLMDGFVVFPNAFKPRPSESTGIVEDDQRFKPKSKDVSEYCLQVFDRWGQMIFESHDVSVGWDGMYNGRLAPQDVYAFKAFGRFTSGKEFLQTGNVLLVR